MCFDRTEDFGQTATGSALPTARPSNLNTALGNGESILGDVWSLAKGVFTEVATIKVQQYEHEQLADLREAEQQAKLAQQQKYAGVGLPTAFNQSGMNSSMALFGGVLILGAGLILATRK